MEKAIERRSLAPAALVLAFVLAPATATAQPDLVTGVAGEWAVRWASGVRTEADGSITVRSSEDAVLALRSVGDSVAGTWTFDFEPVGRVAWDVAGTWDGARLVLESTKVEYERPPTDGPGPVTRQRWVGALENGSLEGELWMWITTASGRELESGPRPWSARRR